MGVVAFCPHGHRVKVKDHLAGRKGICPTCGIRFRIPRSTVAASAGAGAVEHAALPLATVVSLDAAAAAPLPRVLPLDGESPEVRQTPHVPPMSAAAAALPSVPPSAPPIHPLIAERPDLMWCHAVPGGVASKPLDAAAMQAWLDARQATGEELVWRADWADWRPISSVFPAAPPPRGG